MEIKVLGMGCAKCKKLEQIVTSYVSEKGLDATIDKVEDLNDIMAYGMVRTPALVVNEKVVLQGRLPREKELSKYIG